MLKFQKLPAKEDMGCVARLDRRSKDMLDATFRGDAATMAEIIEAEHVAWDPKGKAHNCFV